MACDTPKPLAILLVDDDDDCRLLVRDAIDACGVAHTIYEARNGDEALGLLRKLAQAAGGPMPGLIYLDIEMPGLDGLATLQSIRGDPALRDIPVVMMTGVTDERHMRRAAEYGANSYTIKPANAEQFLRTVRASANYWMTIHQYPERHLPPGACRR